MASIIDRLAATIPAIRAEWRDYRENDQISRDDPITVQAGELAQHVCGLLLGGRAAQLTAFFGALEGIYQAPLGDEDSNAMYEGFMEALIYRAEHSGLSPTQIYAELSPASREVWKQHWSYIHGAASVSATGIISR